MRDATHSPTAEELLAHAGWIRGLARRLLVDPGAADDAVQETWLAALRHPPPADRPLRPWLARVLRNFALQRRRGETSRARREETTARPEALPPAEELVARAEVHRRLVEDVIGLAEPYRSALLLHYFEDLSAAEIARRRGVPASTVRSHLRRGVEQLRREQDSRYGGDGRAWCVALAPLAFPEGLTAAGASLAGAALKGWMMMKGVQIAAAAVLVLLLALAAVRLLGDESEPNTREAAASAPAADALDSRAGKVARSAEPPAPPVAELEPAPERVAVAAPAEPPAEPEIPAEPLPTARLEGVVLDMETDEPVPDFELKLLREDALVERVVSDRNGFFASETAFPAGALALEPVDRAGVPLLSNPETRVRHDPAAPPGEALVAVRVQVGPTYRLELVAPVDLEASELEAFLTSDAPHYGVEEGSNPFNRAPLRRSDRGDGDELWVRFGRMVAVSLDAVGGPWMLEVRSRDGFHAGRAQVSSIDGVQEEVVRIELVPRGRVTGTVRDSGREPIAGAKLRLTPEPGGAAGAEPLRERKLAADEEGRFRIDGVAPGSYVLRAASARHHAAEERVTVQRRLELERDFRLDPLAIAGDVRGEVHSVSGEFHGPVLTWIDGPGEADSHDGAVSWSRKDGEWVGTFAFRDLPPGEHTVAFQTLGGDPLEPSQLTVSPPATDLRVLCRDSEPPAPIAFHVYDAATGEEFPLFQVSLFGPGWLTTYPAQEQRMPLTQLGGTKLEWQVFVGGYVPVQGDASSFEAGESEDGTPLLVAEVPLVRGWGARFFVHDPDGGGLEGATILLDGGEAGTTDAEGFATVSAPSEPEHVGVRYRDWTIRGGDVDPATGAVTRRIHVVKIELAPPE